MITFDDITLVPRGISMIPSRDNIDTSIEFCGVKLDMPCIATPMPDVCNGKMSWTLATLHCMGIIHRFQSIESEVHEYLHGGDDLNIHPDVVQFYKPYVACAIAATGDYEERFVSLYNAGCRIFCMDTANGANIMVKNAIENLRYIDTEKIYIIAGAVATKECYALVDSWGADAVRCGIAGGCFTPSMIVKTSKGAKEIKDVEIGDSVLSHDGVYNDVISKLVFNRDEEIISINGIECTTNHEFYVIPKKCADLINEENLSEYAIWMQADKLTDDYFLIKM